MIFTVSSKKELNDFVYFVKKLYKDNAHYVYPIFFMQKKELSELVLKEKTYKAILYKKNNKVLGRLLYTVDYSKKQEKDICYFSHFECVNDPYVSNALFSKMEEDMKEWNVSYSEGSFTPYDPDTRRGIMIKGFNSDPSIFTSYNFEYYNDLINTYGFKKAIDTVLLNALVNKDSKKKLKTFSKFFMRSHDVLVESIDMKNLENDLKDVKSILDIATNEIVYQDAPSYELIENAARQMKSFINPDFVKIAREPETMRPIGFCLVLPDFNQVFKETRGKLRPFKMMRLKKSITRARGMMQYVIPEYQSTGLIAHMFKVIYDEFEKHGITTFEAGTMMEDNPNPINLFKKFGGDIIKIYRLYGKDLGQ